MSEEAGTANGCGGCLLWGILFGLLFVIVGGIIALFDEPEQGIKMLLGGAFCCLCFFLAYLGEKFEKAIGASPTKTTEKNDVPVGSNSSKRRIDPVNRYDCDGDGGNMQSPLLEEEWQKENPWATSSTSEWLESGPNPYEIPEHELPGNLQTPMLEKEWSDKPYTAGYSPTNPEPFPNPCARIESEQIPPPPKPVFAAKPPRIRKPASSAQPRSVPTRRVRLKSERARLKDL